MNKKFLLICACTLAATAMLGCNEAQNWPDKDNATCGNGIREVGEICDTIASVTCSYYDPTQAWASGTPGCSDTCQLTQGTCSLSSAVGGAYCGNNTIDGAEPCDGYMFADTTMTCASVLGAGATGALTCQNCQISTANCTLPSTCGNGIIDAGEVCDGTQFNGATCTAPGGAQMEGNLRCVDCISIDRSGCTPVEGSYCGDGNIDTADGELCDGSNLGGKTCADIAAGTTGELKCNPSTCQYDTTACVAEPFCGDKVKNNSEECDANDFGTLTCADYKGEGATGNLSCNSDCTVISDACLAADDEPVCGDGFANGTEECDQTDLAGATCASVTGKADAIGTLSCSTSCTLDASACTYCGDGIVNGSEACDGSALNNATCESAMGAGA
ncbi:MAG: hypothetical protein J6S69_03995, partial [Proteobacteria bacterium]|nr:hypothetical protein [Pseudomonadota bacterium]